MYSPCWPLRLLLHRTIQHLSDGIRILSIKKLDRGGWLIDADQHWLHIVPVIGGTSRIQHRLSICCFMYCMIVFAWGGYIHICVWMV